jgi:hypothetical protein
LETRGISTLQGWIEKCLRTARGAHPIHPEDYGIEMPDNAIGRAHDFDTDLELRIREALQFHPRIADVTDFVREDDPDDEFITVSFTVVLDDDSSFPLNTVVLNG